MESHGGHARSEEHRVLLSDPDIVVLARKRLLERLHSRTTWHRGGHTDEGAILTTQLHHCLPKHILVSGRSASLRRRSVASRDVIGPQTVKLLRMLHRGVVPSPLLSQDMDDDRCNLKLYL